MSNVYQFRGTRPAISVPGYNGASATPNAALNLANANCAKHNLSRYLSGAVTGGVYKSVLSVTGAGVLQFVAFGSTGTLNATVLTGRVTIDGIVVKTGASTASNWSGAEGLPIVGSASVPAAGEYFLQYSHVPFNNSLLIEILAPASGTDTVAVVTSYYLV